MSVCINAPQNGIVKVKEILQRSLTAELKRKIYTGFKEHAIQVVGQDGTGDCFYCYGK